jgi:cystathionine beta-lyase/cystathionine gamma-synthase
LYGETDAVGFRNAKLFSIVRDDHHDEQMIAERIRELGADVAVIEGMQNYLGNRIVDVRSLIANLEASPPAKPVHLIVDETLLTGAYPLRELRSSSQVRVFAYLSGTKYLQWGLDSQLMGAVVVPKELEAHLLRVNDYLGLSLTEVSALSYPNFSRELFHWRMKRLTRNGLALSALLRERCASTGRVEVFHPLLDTAERRDRYAFCGSLLTVRAAATKSLLGDGNFMHFHKVIRSVVERCKKQEVPIAYTEGFGFSTPRIYVGWCKNFPPYLRVSAGDCSLSETAMLADVLSEALSGTA